VPDGHRRAPADKDGKETAVVVKQRDGEVTLREPYAAATFSNTGPPAYQSSKDDVAAQFGPRACRASGAAGRVHAVLRRGQGRALRRVAADRGRPVYAEIAKRPVPDVLVVGHTDAWGSDQVNDRCRRSVRRSSGRLDPERIARKTSSRSAAASASFRAEPTMASRIRATGASSFSCVEAVARTQRA
jgi:hypothetical protein